MTIPSSPQNTNASIGGLSYARRLLFHLAALAIVGGLGVLLPTYYKDPMPNLNLPAGTAPEKLEEIINGLTPDQRKDLIARELQQLTAEPLDRAAILNLAVLEGLDKNMELSNALALRAANRSLRDPAAQYSAVGLSLAQKNYGDALMRIDGLLRSLPSIEDKLFPILLSVAAQPDGLGSVTDLLSKEPPWRKSFMTFAGGQTDQSNVFYGLLAGMRDKNIGIADSEVRSYLQHLISMKSFEMAYFVWLDFLSPSQLQKTGPIYDGGFDLNPRNMFFDWNTVATPNVEVNIVPRAGKANDRAMRIVFSQLKGPYLGVYQYMRLNPGKYTLSAQYSVGELRTPAGMLWRVTCLENGAIVGLGSRINSNTPWVTYNFDLTVTPENCSTQILGLTWASDAALDQVITGQLMFDDFKLQNVSAQ